MLAYEAQGPSAAPPVVLLHGWPLDRSIWSKVLAPIGSAGFQVVAVDLPGFGESPPINEATATVEEVCYVSRRTGHRPLGGAESPRNASVGYPGTPG